MQIIRHRKIFYTLSAIFVGFSIFATVFWGVNFGIDFVGGSILEIQTEGLNKSQIQEELQKFEAELETTFSVRDTEDDGFIIRSKTITDDQKNTIMAGLSSLSPDFELQEIRFNTIGPTLGKELQSRAVLAMILVILAIIIFVAIAFRQVSRPVSSWKYGLVAILAFIHDVFIPVGLFAVLGQFLAVEVDTLFVVAILVVLGYSINDTIVVFDRIRENLLKVSDKKRSERFEDVVGKSLRQTIGRSINTSLTTLLALLALFVFGGDSTKWFSLALIAGVISGTYSSIFFAAPMLVTLSKFKSKG